MLAQALFRHAASKPADAVAIQDDRGAVTWRELLGKSVGLSQLIAHSTKADAVGILLPSSAGFVCSFYGTLLAGKIAVPINFLMGDREVAHILSDSGIDTVLTAPPLSARVEALKQTDAKINAIDLTQLPQVSPGSISIDPSRANIPDEKIATYLYTSGTSGLPKGVILSHGSLQRDVEACIEHIKFTGDHKFLGIVPLFHSTGLLATMIAPVQLGASVVYIARFSPVATMKAIREHKISVMGAVPSMYGAMLRLKDFSAEDAASLYAPISGGEPLPPTVREAFFQKFGKHLMEGYGLTETCGPVCFNTPQMHRPGSVGRPIPGAEVRITDEGGTAVENGEVGEVWLRGPMIMKGYLNLPNETSGALTTDGFFRSGDLGLIDTDGYLHITGRKKDLIIVAGEKVYPREVEDCIAQHPAVADVAVLGKKDQSRGEVVVAFVVPREGQEPPTPESIREHCKAKGLIPWKTPREVIVTADLPRNPTGKILKRVLAEQLASK